MLLAYGAAVRKARALSEELGKKCMMGTPKSHIKQQPGSCQNTKIGFIKLSNPRSATS